MLAIDPVNLVRRIIALRKDKRIGVVLVEGNKWWVCTSEIDPHGTKEWYTIERLLEHVESIETFYGLTSVVKKPVASEVAIVVRKVVDG